MVFLLACNGNQTTSTQEAESTKADTAAVKLPLSFTEKVEAAHARSSFLSREAIQFDFRLTFGGKQRMDARMTLLTNSTKGLIEMSNGDKILFDQDKVYHSPGMENAKSIRFSAYTWPYFFLFPYKLSDPGTRWKDYPIDTLNNTSYLTQKLTFAPGTGDAPKDWYIVYADTASHLIEVGAYIVTANKTVEEAEEDPHAIQYLEYQDVDGIPISTHWYFWEWRRDGGLTRQLGEAFVQNAKFVQVEESTFEVPEGFEEI
jgi:hypothetical protein